MNLLWYPTHSRRARGICLVGWMLVGLLAWAAWRWVDAGPVDAGTDLYWQLRAGLVAGYIVGIWFLARVQRELERRGLETMARSVLGVRLLFAALAIYDAALMSWWLVDWPFRWMFGWLLALPTAGMYVTVALWLADADAEARKRAWTFGAAVVALSVAGFALAAMTNIGWIVG